jgi:hypothetical protein
MSDAPADNHREVEVRRSPRLASFVVVFGALGLFATAVATSLYPADPSVGFVALFGYFALYGMSVSVTLGVIVWLVLERRSRRRAKIIRMEREEG